MISMSPLPGYIRAALSMEDGFGQENLSYGIARDIAMPSVPNIFSTGMQMLSVSLADCENS